MLSPAAILFRPLREKENVFTLAYSMTSSFTIFGYSRVIRRYPRSRSVFNTGGVFAERQKTEVK